MTARELVVAHLLMGGIGAVVAFALRAAAGAAA